MNLKYFAAAASLLCLAACDSATSNPAELKGKSFATESAGTPITIVFDGAETRVNGRVVNLYNGAYEVSGNQIKFGPLATTMMMGPSGAMAAEQDYFQFLDTVDKYELTGERLVLKGANGREIVFQQVELDEDANPVGAQPASQPAQGQPTTMPLPAGERPIMRVEDVNR